MTRKGCATLLVLSVLITVCLAFANLASFLSPYSTYRQPTPTITQIPSPSRTPWPTPAPSATYLPALSEYLNSHRDTGLNRVNILYDYLVSPDGNWIAFVAEVGPYPLDSIVIGLLHVDGAQYVHLASLNQRQYLYQWTSDSQGIMFYNSSWRCTYHNIFDGYDMTKDCE